ncbi:MAG TPA: TolC family protein, partial [Isosphaeraceae bacterium]|nr:TolC family protein [Isosphaeraceae bacterium]
DGHSVLGMYKNSKTFDQEEVLEATLQSAVRIALEYRLDLMNTRAQLYDAWRKIRVAANALKGYLNVALTNQVFTPPTTTNPFGFFSQSHQFSLVLNAELPLIRVAERNVFRNAIIAYEQERRALMNEEDFIKNQLRSDIRSMQVTYITYQINKAQLALNIRLKDQAFEQIIAPPQSTTGQSLAQTANAATQTTNLIGFQRQLITSEQAVINAYQAYEAARLTVYRDIGTLPYDEWEAFSELFPSEYRGPALGSETSKSKFAATGAAKAAKAVNR